MGHTNSTPNLHLPQFIGSDKPTWLSDVNGAMLAIDTAYGTIEAQSSSAATAAAGAVTVAGAAQTAADAAGTAAATAGTNATQALSTANNAASVALQAQSDADDALEIASGKLLAEVTADGVKTQSQLLDELFALIDATKLTVKAMLAIDTYRYRAHNISESYVFTSAFTGASYAMFATANIKSTGSTFINASVTTAGTTFTDNSSQVPTSGQKFKIYA